jgi:thioredoxin 1
MIKSVSRDQFLNIIKSGIILVDFWAEWCGPCKQLGPIIDQLEKEYSGKVTVLKLSVDDHSDLASELGTMSIPTVIIIKDGIFIEQIMGLHKIEKYRESLNKLVS